MPKHSNIVRFKVKEGHQKAFEEIAADPSISFPGQELVAMVKTGADTYCGFGIWDSEESMVNARPGMIAFLNRFREHLVEISPEEGVTDPVSGTVLLVKGL